VGTAPRFGIHDQADSKGKAVTNGPAQQAGQPQSESEQIMQAVLTKQNNGFEFFCRTYKIVPELVNEVFPRRISQYMRYVTGYEYVLSL
jgi:hypothetical protein